MTESEARKYKVLVVDDDTDILATMRLALEDLGQQVSTARDGIEALDLAGREDPDIIVLDLMLPRRGGFNILQTLKGKAAMKGKRPLTCMVTGNEGMRHKQFAENLGVDAYLRKPFAMARLIEVVQDFIARLDKGVEDARPKAQ